MFFDLNTRSTRGLTTYYTRYIDVWYLKTNDLLFREFVFPNPVGKPHTHTFFSSITAVTQNSHFLKHFKTLFNKRKSKNCFHGDLRGGEKTGPDKKGVGMDVVNREIQTARTLHTQPKRLVILENSNTAGQTQYECTTERNLSAHNNCVTGQSALTDSQN